MKTLIGVLAILFATPALGFKRHQVERFEQAAPSIHSYHAYLTAVEAELDTDAEVEWESGVRNTIRAIESLLRAEKNHKYDFYERMSARYQDLYTIERSRELREYSEALEDWRWSDGKEEAPLLSTEASADILLKRINVLRDLVSNFPKDPRLPQALWLLSSSMGRMEQDHAKHYFDQLFSRFSKSSYAGFAKVALGDTYFAKGDYKKADAAYKDAVKFKDPDVKNFAAYKLGWTSYMRSLTEKDPAKRKKWIEKTLAAMKLTVLYEKDRERSGRFNLKEEALRDYIWLTSSLGLRGEAFEFFGKLEDEEAPWLYTRFTAEKAMRQHNYKLALLLYEQLIERNIEDPELPQYFAHAIHAASELMQPERAFRHIELLASTVRNEDSTWRQAVEDRARLRERGENVFYSVVRTVGDRMLVRAQKSEDPLLKKALADQSIRYYNFFLKTFPRDEAVADLRFNLASAMFVAHDFRRAADEFEYVAMAPTSDKERRVASIYFKVVSLQNLDAMDAPARLPEFGKAERAYNMAAVKSHLVASIDSFTQMAPESEEAAQFRLIAALQYYNHGHYSEALQRLECIGDNHTLVEQGQQAVQLVLAHLLEAKKWAELQRVSGKFLNRAEIRKTNLAGMLQEHFDYAKYMVKNQ